MKRVFLIVLDSFGIGAMPDSEAFGDVGVNTLAACATSEKLMRYGGGSCRRVILTAIYTRDTHIVNMHMIVIGHPRFAVFLIDRTYTALNY